MNTILTNFSLFFANTMPSIIPVYQRPYRWTDGDLNSLFNDIDEQQILDGQISDSIFVGPITVKNDAGNVYIIDGQQRLTTISLFFIASMHRLNKNVQNELDLINKIKEKLYIYRPDGQAIKLKLKPEDARNYEFVLNKNIEHPNCNKDSLIVRNYINALKLIDKKITPLVDTIEVINNFVVKLNAAKFVQIDLRQTDDAQAIFESLNSKGKDLTTLEQICNLLFMNMTGDEQKRCYEQYWRYIEENIIDDAKVNSFIKAFLTIQVDNFSNIRAVDSYKIFKEYIRKDNVNRTEVMRLLFECAKNYQWLNNEVIHINSPLFEVVSTYRALEITQILPLMLLLKEKYNNNILTNKEFNDIVKIIESYLVRRDICKLSTQSLNKYFSRIALEIKNLNTGLECVSCINNSIINLTGNGKYPDDREIIDALEKFDFYNYSRKSIVIKKLCNSYGIAVNQATTVEHIMPQNLERWENELVSDDEINELRETHRIYRHAIGNLTFLPRSLNAIVGNAPFLNKKNAIATDFAICHDFHNEILHAETQVWNQQVILQRSMRLATQIAGIFPFSGTL